MSLLCGFTIVDGIKSFHKRYRQSSQLMALSEVAEVKSFLQFVHDFRSAAISTSEKDLISTSLSESFGNFMSLKLNGGKKIKVNDVPAIAKVKAEDEGTFSYQEMLLRLILKLFGFPCPLILPLIYTYTCVMQFLLTFINDDQKLQVRATVMTPLSIGRYLSDVWKWLLYNQLYQATSASNDNLFHRELDNIIVGVVATVISQLAHDALDKNNHLSLRDDSELRRIMAMRGLVSRYTHSLISGVGLFGSLLLFQSMIDWLIPEEIKVIDPLFDQLIQDVEQDLDKLNL